MLNVNRCKLKKKKYKNLKEQQGLTKDQEADYSYWYSYWDSRQQAKKD